MFHFIIVHGDMSLSRLKNDGYNCEYNIFLTNNYTFQILIFPGLLFLKV